MDSDEGTWRAAPTVALDMASLLDLERIDRNLFRGSNATPPKGHPAIFGGQVAAQALKAAGLTVAEDRLPHSLHGYYLRPGRTHLPVLFSVDRDRDGGSFSARHVAAIQEGEVIFSMLASFQVPLDGASFDGVRSSEAPPPDEGVTWFDPMLRISEITKTRIEGEQIFLTDHFFVRAEHPLPDDPLTHACAIAYMSDISMGFGQLERDDLRMMGSSIDHALWFHERVRADEWLAMEMWPIKVIGQRGQYLGAMRTADGTLAATLAQEYLQREGMRTDTAAGHAPGLQSRIRARSDSDDTANA